jgi:hypothetical protein
VVVGSIASYGKTTNENDEMDTRGEIREARRARRTAPPLSRLGIRR